MCCENDWKREVVQDYKWDYVDVREFRKTDFMTRFKYMLVFVCIIRDLAIISLDVFTCVTMISSSDWKTAVFAKCKTTDPDTGKVQDNCSMVQFNAARWVFVGCIFFSFLLYAYEFYKARKVVLSRDVSYSYTNIMANDYYSIKDYNNFCLYCHLGKSKKRGDKITFFVFFTFKNWKRVILADGPRQCINALMLYLVARANHFTTDWDQLSEYWNDSVSTLLLLLAMLTTIGLFLLSFIQLAIAFILYFPVLFYIQGNLKEYVCHKVDKRMAEVMRRMQKQRFNRAVEFEKKLAKGETITNSKGEAVDPMLLQPTLPVITLDDDKEEQLISGRMSPAPRPMSPHNGRPMAAGAPPFRPMSPGAAPLQPTVTPAWGKQPPKAVPDEVTEMDIYDAYTDDATSVDDHSSYHGHGSNHGHVYGYAPQLDSSKVSLLGGAAPMGHSYPPPPSYPPGASIAPPMRSAHVPTPVSRPGLAPRASPGQVMRYDNRAELSAQFDVRSPPADTPLTPARYDRLHGHGW